MEDSKLITTSIEMEDSKLIAKETSIEIKEGMIGDIPNATQSWRCCTLGIDKGIVVCSGQFIISVLILGFCGYALLAYDASKLETGGLFVLLTMVASFWFGMSRPVQSLRM